MTIERTTSITYEDDALKSIYDKRIRMRLRAILERLDANPDANMRQFVDTWYPDANVRVVYNIQPGVTNPIIRVRVEKVERKQAGGGDRQRKKKSNKRPYLWIGIASYDNFTNETWDEPNPPTELWGTWFPPLPQMFGFEPTIPGRTFAHKNLVEDTPGAVPFWCQAQFEEAWYPDCNRTWPDFWEYNAQVGAASEGAGDQDRWEKIATVKLEQHPRYDWYPCPGGGLCSDLMDTDDVDTLEWVFHDSKYCYRSESGMRLFAQTGTQIYAPAAAYNGGLPPWYWQKSLMIDPEGINPARNPEIGYARYIDSWDYSGEMDSENLVLSPSEIIPGQYRFDFLMIGFECAKDQAKMHIRMILGRPGTDEEDPENPDLEAEQDWSAPPSNAIVVDFFPENIGNGEKQTVANGWYYRAITAEGFWDRAADPFGYGNNWPSSGWWDKTLYVDVLHGSWITAEYVDKPPFLVKGTPIGFNECDCNPDEGAGTFDDDTFPDALQCDWTPYVNGIKTPYGVLFWGCLAECIRRCGAKLTIKVIAPNVACGGAYGQGYVAWAYGFRQQGDTFVQDAYNTNIHAGDIVMIVATPAPNQGSDVRFGVVKYGSLPAHMRTEQFLRDFACDTGYQKAHMIEQYRENGPYFGYFNQNGEWIPTPKNLSYSTSGHGFVVA